MPDRPANVVARTPARLGMHLVTGCARACGSIAVRGVVALLRVYRATLSYAFGPCCRFHPSCSVYADEAIRAHGIIKGGGLAAWRLLRCHPFATSGVDPVPVPQPRQIERAWTR